jgi:hypothetical protein
MEMGMFKVLGTRRTMFMKKIQKTKKKAQQQGARKIALAWRDHLIKELI